MKHWTPEQYSLETLDKMPTEDKIILSEEEDLWYFNSPREEWRELALEERLLLYMDIIAMVPEEQITQEVREAITEAIAETERILLQPR